ncbi:S-formylglutathione hydrolase [uncultured Alcanivorax sp.]|uniref:S-formylglutathione hydrolase n=1 Tax=uncultured Alcanivorax sp. TaxID=191215 RepID=UPI0026250512|nr:S-formylglutathione hydrolase [uncultured Alcanivorax sp.]
MSDIELVSATKSFGGWLKRYKHRSQVLNCEMIFAIYLPPAADENHVPLLWWLSGLTCTDENFMQKAGAQRTAAELGLAMVCPDTSPRGTDLPGEHDSYDFGSGAGFYVNATRAPWSQHYRMYDYVIDELPALLRDHFPLNGREAISGHSMGGHGALICALKNPGRYTSVSAFAPISHPMQCPWGKKALNGFLGDDQESWKAWDACELVKAYGSDLALMVDQGDADNFYTDGQLQPEALSAACEEAGVPITLRMQPGYDHSYFFIASFIDDHLKYHFHHLTQ